MDSQNNPNNDQSVRKPVRLVRPSIVVLCGPAGCGKSTFAARHFRPTQIISSDWARGRVADDESDQRYNAQAFALVHFLAEQRLALNRLCVIDSTALGSQDRREFISLAKKFQVPATLLVFDVAPGTCIARDEKRERTVGSAVIERQYEAFAQSKETIRQEGFDQMIVFQNGEEEKVQIEILFRPVSRPPAHLNRTDANASRRLERAAAAPREHPRVSGGNGHAVSAPGIPPGARPGPRPDPQPATVRAQKTEGTPLAQTPRPQPPAPPRPAASPAPPMAGGVPPKEVVPSKGVQAASPLSASAEEVETGKQ